MQANDYNDQFRYTVENLTDAILVINQSLELIYLNPAAEALLALSYNQVKNVSIDTLFPSANKFLSVLKRGLETREQFTRREMELPLPHAGHTIKVDCSLTYTRAENDQIQLIVELQQIDRMLRIAREETLLAQQNAVKVLVRGLAHEIKNPLGGLRGAAQLLERELPSEHLKEYTQIIIGEADRLQKLVDDMLGPNRPPRKTFINIHEALEHVRQLVTADSSNALALERDYDPSIPELEADRNQLVQAVLNIVQNAKQALDGRGKITLRTRTHRQFTIGQTRHRLVIRIDIIDNGPGIPDDLIHQIFYPMVTGRPEGTGLGLSIAQTLIGQHGGLIECSSKPGHTVFSILLPLTTTPFNQTQKRERP